MKRVTNPKDYTHSHASEPGANLRFDIIKVSTSDISDCVLGGQVEIKSGTSINVIDKIADVLVVKYPWLEVTDYVKPEKVVKKKTTKSKKKK